MLLENNGVKSQVFLKYQRAAAKEAQECLISVTGLCRTLERYSLGSSYAASSLLRILNDHKIFDLDDLSTMQFGIPGFIRRFAQLVHVHVLRELKHHARIPVPNAWTLVGVADEWDMLNENEVYGGSPPTGDVSTYACLLMYVDVHSVRPGKRPKRTYLVGGFSVDLTEPDHPSRRCTICDGHRATSPWFCA